jgi:hypothetical protein
LQEPLVKFVQQQRPRVYESDVEFIRFRFDAFTYSYATMSSMTRWLFSAILFCACLAADDGDDFSNNLFSDLAP